MRVVIEIRARRHHPVDEPGLDERDDGRHAQSCRRHCAGETHPDGDVILEHPFRKQAAAFRKSAGVVRKERVIDELGDGLFAGDRLGIDALAAQVLVLGHRVDWLIGCMARNARVRRSRASRIQPSASFGSSVTRNNFKSSGEILPSPATRSLSQSASPRQ